MRIQITQGGIFGQPSTENPTGELAIGTKLTVDKAPDGWAGRYIDLDAQGENKNADEIDTLKARIAELEGENASLKANAPLDGQPLNKPELTSDGENPKPGAETGPSDVPVSDVAQANGGQGKLEARDTGSGWWTIFDANNTEIGKKLRKDDAEAFNAMSDQDKSDYVKAE